MLCLACEYRRSEGSAGLTGYILWPAAVPWTGGFSIQTMVQTVTAAAGVQ